MIDGITIEIMEDIDYIIDNCILYTKFDYVIAENGAYPPTQNGLIHPQLLLKWP